MESFFKADIPSLILRPKQAFKSVCDVSSVRPSSIATLDRAEIEAIQLYYDSQWMRLNDLFEVIGDPSLNLVFEGDCSKLSGIGAGMDGGTISVRGNAGAAVASKMKAGRIEVLGDCGDWLAMEMRGGTVIVHGSAGDNVANPGVGQQRGMRGGDCIVLGDVGSRAAERMRRGMLYIGGNAGDYGAAQLIAGTVIAMGEIGSNWAIGMKRGSIILSQPATREFAAELTPPREFELSFLPLVWRHIESLLGNKPIGIPQSRWAMRQLGDRANQGMGEILTLSRK